MGKIIILYGLPAAGKTTQAKMIAEKYGLYHFAMGEKLREQIASGSELGQKIKSTVDSGLLVSDELILEVLRDVKNQAIATGIIFDGFPRIVDQAILLDQMLAEVDLEVSALCLLKISSEAVDRRISDRIALENRGDDKDKSVVENRMNVFLKESIPLSSHYRDKNKFYELDGEEPIENIFQKLCEIIEK
ncbi:MAG: nucleoside monophosphate kinase [Candidatus Falkowbacteria bacterium]